MSDAPASEQKKGPIWADCHFETGFTRGNDQIKKVRLRKPIGGDLRGLSLKDLMQADVDSIIAVLPRISDPIMTQHDAASLEAQDIAEAGGTITAFFYTSEQKKMMLGESSTS